MDLSLSGPWKGNSGAQNHGERVLGTQSTHFLITVVWLNVCGKMRSAGTYLLNNLTAGILPWQVSIWKHPTGMSISPTGEARVLHPTLVGKWRKGNIMLQHTDAAFPTHTLLILILQEYHMCILLSIVLWHNNPFLLQHLRDGSIYLLLGNARYSKQCYCSQNINQNSFF